MATTRPTGFVITAAIWNAVLSGLNDAGNVFTGVSATFSGALSAAAATFTSVTAGTLTSTSGASIGAGLAVNGDVTAQGKIFERGRSVAMGEEIAVAYNAAHFNVNLFGLFTVQSGDVAVNSYTLIGKQMFWCCQISGASIVQDVNVPTQMLFTIPGGFTVASPTSVAVAYCNINGAVLTCTASASGSTVTVNRSDAGTLAPNTNATIVVFDIRIAIA